MGLVEMLILDLTLNSPAENLALDEALLLAAEEGTSTANVLRIWEPAQSFVVLGSSSRYSDEVNVAACESDNVPVLRRPSGGAAIVAGPGCLMYAVVLSYERHPHLQAIDIAHRHVLGQLVTSIGSTVGPVRVAGTSDLAIGDRKFSGNSMRCKRQHLLYHGTLLYDFPLELIERYLRTAPRQPDYRARRSHGEFVTNLSLGRAELVEAVRQAFDTDEALSDWPRELTAQLARDKYSNDDWNRRL